MFRTRKWFIENYKINQIYFGDLIYDTYVRNDNNYDKKYLFNLTFIKLLLITYYKFLFIDDLINKHKFQFIISNTHTYASNSAIAMRIALSKN